MGQAADVGVGAVSGAAQGFAVAGPAGAVVGGILGAVQGLFGSKSRKAAKKANDIQNKMSDVQNAVLRRNQLREAFITRQTALAAGAAETGGLQSSTVQGALGSIGSQFAYNERYFDTQQANINLFNKYAKKSSKFADYAGAVGQLKDAGLNIATRMPRFPKFEPGMNTTTSGASRSTGMGTLGNPVA